MWNGLKRIGWLLVLLACLSSPLLAQESGSSKLTQLEEILIKLEAELQNSKILLIEQERLLTDSSFLLDSLRQEVTDLKSYISDLEITIASLKKEIQNLQSQTIEVSDSLQEVSKSFDNYKKTTTIIYSVGGTVILTLAIILAYKYIEDKQ